MRAASPRAVWIRAIVGLIALYALSLQAFIASASAKGSLDPVASICAEHGPAAPDTDPRQSHDHGCCTAVHIGTVAPPPPAASAAMRAALPAIRVAWRPEAAIPRTGPPVHAHSARGPPVA